MSIYKLAKQELCYSLTKKERAERLLLNAIDSRYERIGSVSSKTPLIDVDLDTVDINYSKIVSRKELLDALNSRESYQIQQKDMLEKAIRWLDKGRVIIYRILDMD